MFTRLLCALCLLLPSLALADGLNLAVAANFKRPLEQLVALFDPRHEHDITISSASTGMLYTQIHQGAPFDIFFAADRVRPERLEREGLGLPGSRMTYATGQLALWQPAGQPVSIADLSSGALAIANPRTAPYGLAAQQALTAIGRWNDIRVIQGSNIAQAFQFIHSGNVSQGLVAQALLIQQNIPASQWAPVDPRLHLPVEQQLIRLRRSAGNPLAERFIEFLHSEPAQELITQSGYISIEGANHAAH
ncbi:molybdate ABC transporter substrate-binding protein [Marinobacterium sediminicola]|uniref:Molybdate transport system substrate-binding protein n=1 Tax=Marinobacterium sediminicola TaxID=518898 RepID=A0ABY1S021_9GAMM|nr:molybdate ABC transporter substrate-binding protein [Marinobacterium sediminicola]ULG69999.1 molybdate ABC transporter substrate-binding protein [Marinobacterium sediminicola]SMR74453.1 molybdate transport system substrate-binding protein [Marinobacterium sediminicola]